MALHAMSALGQVARSYGFRSKMKTAVAADDIKLVARKLQNTDRRPDDAKSHIEVVLGTINAPRPRPIDAKSIVRCLTNSRPTRAGVHISKHSSTTSRRNLVLVGVVTFEDLCRAARLESHLLDTLKELACSTYPRFGFSIKNEHPCSGATPSNLLNTRKLTCDRERAISARTAR